MDIVIGADHAGFRLKQRLLEYMQSVGILYEDVGCFSEDSVDYPEISRKVAQQMQGDTNARGIICCGSGIGVAMAANRFPHIRAVEAHDHNTVLMSRKHNNSNVLCLGGRVISPHLAIDLLTVWLNTEFEGARHERRVDMMTHLSELPSEAPPSC